MRPTLFFPVLLVALLAAASAAPLLAGAQAQTVPLEAVDAGVVKPGYVYRFRLHAVGIVIPGVIVYGLGFADAIIDIQGSRVGISGDDGAGLWQHVYVVLPGERRVVDTVYTPGKREYDAVVTLTAYCPGEQAAGLNPGSDGFVVEVRYDGVGGTFTRYIVKRLGGEQNVGAPVTLYYEKTLGVESWVQPSYGYPMKFRDCGGNVIGRDPGPGDDTRNDDSAMQELVRWIEDLGTKLAYAMLGLFAVAIILPVLLKR